MKAIILAAGLGTRISRHIGDKPKCLVEIAGRPLIRHTVDLLTRKGISEIAVVTGYKSELVEQALPETVQIFRNPFFAVSNSIASLWFARDFIGAGQTILAMNGDVFIEEAILDQILQTRQSDRLAVMVADSSRIIEADYKFTWHNGNLVKYGKELTADEATGEYVGLGLIFPSSIDEFVWTIESEVAHGNYNKWWEEALYMKVNIGKKIGILDICEQFWVELDFVEDLNRLNFYLN
jgi:choline kinase